jgi:WD repeat and SOF domain-containing protein 1
MRRLDKALNVHMDFTSAGFIYITLHLSSHNNEPFLVMDVDYSPTGLEFVAGGFDQSIRLFKTTEGRSQFVLPLTFCYIIDDVCCLQ